MLNREIFQNDPVDNFLANNGVAKVTEERTPEALATLDYELKTFVCDGKYQQGVELILNSFLTSLKSSNEQKGVWISGFFGSGKSHLAKMLSSLWVDQALPSGQTARSIADLPASTQKLLEELSIQAGTHNGLHSAAGTLGASAGKKVRLALLAIIFKSVGLPEKYHLAKFCLWLKSQNAYDAVKKAVVDTKPDKDPEEVWTKEIRSLHVSPVMHKAVMQVLSDLASSATEVREMLRSQFAIVTDVSNDDMVEGILDALSTNGEIPLTMVVLDEVQQYVGADVDRAMDIQEVVETCCKASKLKSKLLFIATGQSSLSAMPNLQRILGRFQTLVQLGESDVDAVIRKVILQKKETARPHIERVIENNLGEISRHLHGSPIGHKKDDEKIIVADYPLLPVRRRFWEKVLHALDATGTGSQLRNQLRIVHEACKATAEKELGHVLAADFIYDQISTNLLQTSVISKDIYETIERKKAGDHGSQQQGRILALVLLIGKLPTDVDHGIHSTEDTLADLLIEDLQGDKHKVRSELPNYLQALEKEGLLMSIDTDRGMEYRLQTAESSQWYDEFSRQKNDYRGNPQRIENFKQQIIQRDIRSVVRVVNAGLLQGNSNVGRNIVVSFDAELPQDSNNKLYAWVHNSAEKSFVDHARGARPEQSTIFIYVPNSFQSELSSAIIEEQAAKMTLEIRGSATTEAGRDARSAMENSNNVAKKKCEKLLAEIFDNIQVKLAGGADAEGDTLKDQIQSAGNVALARLYKDFAIADDANWDKVYNKARREGGENALDALGFKDETAKHPVCQAVLRYIGVGKLGSEIRKNFIDAPYGWPQDAIDGALFAMLAAGALTGNDATGQAVAAKKLDRSALGQVSLRPEKVQLSKIELVRVRSLIQAMDVTCNAGEEQANIVPALKCAKKLAYSAGGNAPLPASPNTDYLDELMTHSGNELLRAALDSKDQITTDLGLWQETIELAINRQVQWGELRDVLKHCNGLVFTGDIEKECQAIVNNRSLLVSPNPVEPLIKKSFNGIRDAIVAHHGEFQTEYNRCLSNIESDEQWKKLSTDDQQSLLMQHGIGHLPTLNLANNEAVLSSLDTCSLNQWNDKRASLMSKFEAARNAAIDKLEPQVQRVQAPRQLIETEADLESWLAQATDDIRNKLTNGPVSVI